MKSRWLVAVLAGSALIGTAMAVAPASSASSGSGGARSIDQYAWHQRVLVVFADSAQSASLTTQRDMLAHSNDAMAERDLVLVEVIGETVKGASDSADALRRRYGVKSGAFRALLIGKDGGVKLDSPEPITVQKLATTIDAMPMRRQEMHGS